MVKRENLIKPGQIAEMTGFPKPTIQSYLGYSDVFPPEEVQENGYRLYPPQIVKELILLRKLMKDPFRLKKREVFDLFMEEDREKLCKLFEDSPNNLFDYIRKQVYMGSSLEGDNDESS